MILDRASKDQALDQTFLGDAHSGSQDLYHSQQIIFDFLLSIVKTWPPAQVLEEFKHLFIDYNDASSADTLPALYSILFANDEGEFHNTLKRSCYILINNWDVARQYDAISQLVATFDAPIIRKQTFSPTLKRLRQWLLTFIDSSSYQELKLFSARLLEGHRPITHWSQRYTSYLLVPQYIDAKNPAEQRDIARTLSRRLKDKFKRDLALYAAHANSRQHRSRTTYDNATTPANPTALGDEALRLIKYMVMRRGRFSHRSIARMFVQQTQEASYRGFKRNLPSYLVFSIAESGFTASLTQHLGTYLGSLYQEHDNQSLNRSLILRTCNRIIDQLTTVDKQSPSYLFTLLLSQENPLTLATVLLKIILISRNSNLYLEARIADLIRYYNQFPQEECQWIINFLEVFSITFAIYAEDIEYNLVGPSPPGQGQNDDASRLTKEMIDSYRIFSQQIQRAAERNEADLHDFSEDLALEEDSGELQVSLTNLDLD